MTRTPHDQTMDQWMEHHNRMKAQLNPVHRTLAVSVSQCARSVRSMLQEHENAWGNAQPEIEGAAADLAGYLDGTRPTPESNRNGIPHARDWDTRHAMHLVRDLEFALDEARQDIPDSLYASAVRGLLELTVEIAVTSSYEDTKPFLDRMVRGELPDQLGTPVFETEKGIGKSDP